MNKALVTACVLLALIVALRADRSEALSRERAPLGEAAPETPIIVYSAGEHITPLQLRQRPMHDAIILDGALLSIDPEIPGLRALRMDAQRHIDTYRNFDTAHKPGAAEALDRFARATPVDGLLVLSASGALQPEGELAARRRDTLVALLGRLGLDSDLIGTPSPSLCLIALKRRDGWTQLGLALSNVEPMRLALFVDGARHRYNDAEPLSIDGRVTVLELANLAGEPSSNASIDREGVLFQLSRTAPKNLDPERDGRARGRVSWQDLALGPGATLTCGLLLREPGAGPPSLSDGEVLIDLLLDGELVTRERLQRTQSAFAGPRVWRVPLRTSSGRPCRIDLRLAQPAGSPPVDVLVVRPLITSRAGAEHAP